MFFAIAFALGTMGITNAQEINGKFMAEFSKLNTYLGLESTQLNEVYEINNYFKETQREQELRRANEGSVVGEYEINERRP